MAVEKKKPIGTLIKSYPVKRYVQVSQDQTLRYDAMLVFYRDDKGVKKYSYVNRAETSYCILKKPLENPPMFIEADKVEKIIVYSDMLYRDIAMRTNSLPFYDKVVLECKGGQYNRNMMNLFKHPMIYDADMDLADRYISKFNRKHDPDLNYNLHKTFFDIEVDLMPNGFKDTGYHGFPNEDLAPCPINIISLIDDKAMIGYIFIIRNPLNESQKQMERDVETFKKDLLQEVAEEDKVSLNDIKIMFFDDELDAIKAFFKTIHDIDPDFAGAWNMCFDIKTILNRIVKLVSRDPRVKAKQLDPKEAMASIVADPKYMLQKTPEGQPVYLTPEAYYYAQKDKQVVDRMDSFTVLDGIQWLDQMLVYANIRKSSGQKELYSLNFIANEELGREKLPFKAGETIKNLPWKDFKKFARYNFRDTLLLFMLEQKNLDFDLMQKLAQITNTRVEKVLKKTISLKNFVNKFAIDNGFVMANNKNAKPGELCEIFDRDYLDKKPPLENDPDYIQLFNRTDNFGAYVGDPLLNNPQGIPIITTEKSKFIYSNVFDVDFASLYPSIIMALNLSANSQVGKFFLKDERIKQVLIERYGLGSLFLESVNEQSKSAGEKVVDLGPMLTDSLQAMDINVIGNQFLGLPSTEDMYQDIMKNKN